MAETGQETKTLTPKDKLKEEILAKHRLMRVLPRTQMELREQEDALAEAAIQTTMQNIFSEAGKMDMPQKQKAEMRELSQKYGLNT